MYTLFNKAFHLNLIGILLKSFKFRYTELMIFSVFSELINGDMSGDSLLCCSVAELAKSVFKFLLLLITFANT